MSTWAAVVIGIGSGVATGLVGTLATISHERAAEFRTRMLTAAEDFTHAATDAFLAVASTWRMIHKIEHEEGAGAAAGHGDAADAAARATETAETVTMHAVRVSLLFGELSFAAGQAREVANALREAQEIVHLFVAARSEDAREGAAKRYHTNTDAVAPAISAFTRAARDEIRRTHSRALVARLHRWLTLNSGG